MLKNYSLTLDQSITQRKGNIVSNMGGEKVMLSIENGKYYNLGEVGGDIWDTIENPVTITELVDTLMAKYEIDKETCLSHVLSFIEMLKDEELIKFN
ncbi:coenzyme PQQ synthesis protein D (PqqD) [Bacillus sp. V-88]|nr:metallophosphoesterase [Bacillus sp. DSM 27956]PRX75764.1 coenzyme PQQ synthesis protein D (PqqD) [Bacillus sp. V-88]SLK23413.1 Coenzyme PQQ synthesis protein D (PqqD) [Bacillus sp. V-88]